MTVPLFPGGFGVADANCATVTPANTTAVRMISQSALRLLILIACSFPLYLWDPGLRTANESHAAYLRRDNGLDIADY